jgi:thiol-disulfide isomerase/thioredoxin
MPARVRAKSSSYTWNDHKYLQGREPMAKRKGISQPASAATRDAGQRNLATHTRATGAVQTGRRESDAPARSQSQGRGAARRRAQRIPWWRKGSTLISVAVVLIVVIVAVFVYMARGQGNTGNGETTQLVPASIAQAVSQVSPQVIDAVNTGGVSNILTPTTSGTATLTGAAGKPEFLYVGAEYCPYCAAERWSMIVALSRFGTFSHLHLTTSSGTDIYPNTPTFTFYGSQYSSKYVDFVSVEEATRNPNTPLQTPTAAEQQLVSQYDNGGSIPFLDIANQYTSAGAGYSPQLLAGLTQQEVAAKLSNSSDPVTQAIVGNANYLTAAICKATNNQPGNVCTAGPIPQLEQQLPQG